MKRIVFTKEVNKITSIAMMIREYNQSILWKHMHMKKEKRRLNMQK